MTGLLRTSTITLLAVFLVVGCREQPSETIQEREGSSSRFAPHQTGVVTGEVCWEGEPPDVSPFTVWNLRGNKPRGRFLLDNPNAPRIDPTSRGVSEVLVYLRGVDPATTRPWSFDPASVEIGAEGLRVRQGDAPTHIGLVHRGDAVEMRSTETEFHALRATGAAAFTLPFPDPDQPLSRRFDRAGVVELTSGTGHYWWRAYLFVSDHSACGRTDARGRFTLPETPAGRYELVCWAPNWNTASHDRDPESSRITRLRFRPPLEKTTPVEVQAGRTTTVRVELTKDEFAR